MSRVQTSGGAPSGEPDDTVQHLAKFIAFIGALVSAFASGVFINLMTGSAFWASVFGALLFVGYQYIHNYALDRLPGLDAAMRKRVLPILSAVAAVLVLISVFTSFGAVSSPAARELHLRVAAEIAEEGAERSANISSGLDETSASVGPANTLSGKAASNEKLLGTYSGNIGGGVVFAELNALAVSAEATLHVVVPRLGDMEAKAAEIEESAFVLKQLLNNPALSFDERMAEAEERVPVINEQVADLTLLIPTGALRSFTRAFLRDFAASGIDPVVAEKIEQQFRTYGEQVDKGLRELNVIAATPPRTFKHLNEFELIVTYAGQNWALLAICICIDLLALLPLILSVVAMRPAEIAAPTHASHGAALNGAAYRDPNQNDLFVDRRMQ